jgi:PBS lyase HEAT-like repeat
VTAPPSDAQVRAIDHLDTALRAEAGLDVEAALKDAFSAGLHPAMVPSLIELADAPWHSRHEDVVSSLQRIKSPSAVPALERIAQVVFPYAAYDDFDALHRKCTWALADIGTPEARSALERLAISPIPNVARYATKRLENWNAEVQRKGA